MECVLECDVKNLQLPKQFVYGGGVSFRRLNVRVPSRCGRWPARRKYSWCVVGVHEHAITNLKEGDVVHRINGFFVKTSLLQHFKRNATNNIEVFRHMDNGLPLLAAPSY